MSTTVDLEFHESGGDDILFDQSSGQTHTFHNFPASAVDEEEDDGGDKSQLLKEDDGKKSPSFWTFEYYQQFFDVETRQVFHRVTGSMIPLPKRNYLELSIRPNPDLYGPFWICTTLVFTTAIAGNLANYLSSAGKDYHWKYDFHKVTFAATAIFSYWWLIPAIMSGFLWWRKSHAGFTFLEILCVYGYSLAIYIPISILWVINVTWFKWVLVIVGAVLSGGVLVITFWPAVKEESKNIAVAFIGLVFLFHLGLAAGFLLYFFHVPPQSTVSIPTTPVPPKLDIPEKAQQEHLRLKTEAMKVKVKPDVKNDPKPDADIKTGVNAKANDVVPAKSDEQSNENTPVENKDVKSEENVNERDVPDSDKDKQQENKDEKDNGLIKEKIKRNALKKTVDRKTA